METSHHTRKVNSIKEDKEQDEHNEKVNSISESKSRVRSIKPNDEFEQPHRKSRKKHYDWMRHNSVTYCPKFLKDDDVHRETSRDCLTDKSCIFDFPREDETLLRSIAAAKKRDKIAEDGYYASVLQQRMNFRIHLIRRIIGLEAEMYIDDAERRISEDEDVIDRWLTREDKNLLRYYHYILHDVDDTHAGTLDSDTK
ncbi:PREDICTED: uncharacterized protein LOC106748853 [Dinoponera quadriceps]|uniref:Uncharacterized protein LOC106748853 n=1 Tax=Dinoponera quadriceps TaxID=609295 RepID=A0A6P3XZ20_DINQU|nr:PREDICTED: uncharacterized protein LOC106748853 [Dinoponera quadriceps]